jgi:hypothetical protein
VVAVDGHQPELDRDEHGVGSDQQANGEEAERGGDEGLRCDGWWFEEA